jgi:hypothetical protein
MDYDLEHMIRKIYDVQTGWYTIKTVLGEVLWFTRDPAEAELVYDNLLDEGYKRVTPEARRFLHPTLFHLDERGKLVQVRMKAQ